MKFTIDVPKLPVFDMETNAKLKPVHTSQHGRHGNHAPNRAVKAHEEELDIASGVKLVMVTVSREPTVHSQFKLPLVTEVIAVTGNGLAGPVAVTTASSAATSVTDSNATVVLMRWSVNRVTASPTPSRPVPPFKLNQSLSAPMVLPLPLLHSQLLP